MSSLTTNDLCDYLLSEFADISQIHSWGETSFFYNLNNTRTRGAYFCTIKEKDSCNDQASRLDRGGLFRFNFGITKQTFVRLFDVVPKRPSKGKSIEGSYDFTKIDQLMPHPIYGWMYWVSITSPSNESLEKLRYLIEESYELARSKFNAAKL